MLTFTPGASRNWPSVTTVSPAFNAFFDNGYAVDR